jgi:hypothetical protein
VSKGEERWRKRGERKEERREGRANLESRAEGEEGRIGVSEMTGCDGRLDITPSSVR